MTMNRFELIIYIPTFNRSEKLKNCLDIITKEICGFEDKVLVYVSNNGSTDGTKEYLQSLDYKWLHIRHNSENIGFALNVLHCFDLPIESEFVWPIGDDEYLMPNSISGLLLLIKEYLTADYIFCNTKAFSNKNSTDILRNYLKTGSIAGGVVKSRKYIGTSIVDFEQLIDPDIADTLLGELMVNCFRQSSMRSYKYKEIDFNVNNVDWGKLDFETVGKLCQPHNLPFLSCFNGKTKAVYCDVPRTFNFWGSAEWLGDYDYTFPIIILFLITQYKEHGFISDTKYLMLLDYYYSIMRNPLARQINGQSTARPFNSKIKAKMFDFLFEYTYRRLEESSKSTVTVMSQESNHKMTVATQPPTASGITSIIILTFNQLEYTKGCMKSIQKHTPEPHEIIFVDNGSTDGTLRWLRKLTQENKNYTLIENKENLGFAKGCNQGIETSRGEFILLLNNDVVVSDGWLSGLMECLNHGPAAGIVGPMTNNISGPQQVFSDEYRSVNDLNIYAAKFRTQYRHRRIPLRRIVGFCMLFKRELAEEIGMLDESFGTGNFEDDDFCLRAALAGYTNYIAGDVFIHHYGSRSFIGNKIDYSLSISGNIKIFEEKWTGLELNTPLGKKVAAQNFIDKAEALYQKGGFDRAIAMLIEGIRYAPEEKVLYYHIAEMLLDNKLYKDALEAINSITLAEKDDLRRLEIIAYCKEGLGETGEYTDQLLEADKNSAPALNLKGMNAYKQGNHEAAEDFFRQAIAADPGYGEPYTNLGVMKWASDQKEEALDYLEKGFILSPKMLDNVTLYHSAITELEQFAKAEGFVRDAKALHPENKRILFFLIDILIKQHKYYEAMDEIEKAMLDIGIDDGMLAAALEIRNKVGIKEIDKTAKNKGALSLCMIVKDEEQHLARCLLSARPVVDEMIIVDTGSTDRTKDIAQAYGAKVFDFPWTNDFSAARNHSLSMASGDWIIVLDADEVISPLDYAALEKIVKRKPAKPAAYSMVTRNYTNEVAVKGWTANDGRYGREEAGTGWFPSTKVRLFINDKRIQFQNPVHEFVEASLGKAGIEIKALNIPVHHYGRFDKDKLIRKGREYFLLGRQKIEEMNGDIKALKELAVQASELGEYETGVELWKKVIEHDGNDSAAFLNISYAYMKLEKYQDALASSRKTLELEPTMKEAALNYAGSELIIGDIKKTISILETLLQKNPDYPPAMALVAAAYYINGQKEAGLVFFEKLRKRGFNCTEFLDEQYQGVMSQDKLDQAISLLEAAIKTGYINKDTHRLLEECKNKKNNQHA